MGEKTPLQGRQLGDALERATRRGVVPIDRVNKQKAKRSGDKNDGREAKAPKKNNLKERDMNQQTTTENGTQKQAPVQELTTEQAISAMANAVTRRLDRGEPVVAIATVVPLQERAKNIGEKLLIVTAGSAIVLAFRKWVFKV